MTDDVLDALRCAIAQRREAAGRASEDDDPRLSPERPDLEVAQTSLFDKTCASPPSAPSPVKSRRARSCARADTESHVDGQEPDRAAPKAPSEGEPRARTLDRKRPSRVGEELVKGHRERLRARFNRGETFEDYELMELLLFRSNARSDTKPTAKALIKRFGSFAKAIAARPEDLREVDGIGDSAIADFRLVRTAAERFARQALTTGDVLSSTDAVVQYYRTCLRTAGVEEFHVLFVDKRNQFLASERLARGTVDHTPVYPRELMKRALEHGASAIILVHNHPSGDPTPSQADVAMTQRIVSAAEPLGIAIHDHLVIGANDYVSFRAKGLMG